MIKDIIDKAKIKENSKISKSSVLYNNKLDKKNKSKVKDKNKEKRNINKDNDKDYKTCPYYKNLNLCYKLNNYLEDNDKKIKE